MCFYEIFCMLLFLELLVCNEFMDVVFLVDVLGSVGVVNFDK